MANETEKTILPYLNVLEVETIDKSNVTKVIVIDKDDEVKVMDGSQLATNSYFDLQDKPEINGIELNGNMTSEELGLASSEDIVTINSELEQIKSTIPSAENIDNQITERLADYPTKEEVTTEISDAVANKADKSEIPTKTSQLTNDSGFISSLDGYATEKWVEDNYLTKEATESAINSKQNKLNQGDGIVIEENTISADYNTIRNKPSLNGTELSGAASIVPAINIQSVPSKVTLAPVFGNQTGEAVELPIYNTETNQAGIVNGPLYAQLADKYTKAEIDALKSDIPTKVSELTNDSNFVTEAEVSGDLAGKADKTYVDGQLATKQPVGDYATKIELAGKADSSVVESLSTQVATNTSDISIIKTKQEEDGNKIDALDKEMATKQDLLVSGTNIKTINSQSLLGEGNIEIESGSNIPFLFINSTTHLSGDFAAVKNAIANKTPFELYYVNILGYGDIAAPEVCFVLGENIQATFHFESTTANHTVVQTTITPTGVSADTSYHSYQEQLVSGTNIKTINGQDILGSGNLDISGGTTDYNQLTNKPQINSVELSGNKSLEDLGVPTKTSELTNDSGFLTSIPDEYVTETELNAGLGNKQDTLVSGTNIKTVNGESLLGSGNIDIESVSNPVTYGSGTQPQVHTILVVTQSEYDAISSKDPNTQYLIVE